MTVIVLYLQELEIAYDLATEIVYEISKLYLFPDYLITTYIDELDDFHFSSDLQISKCKEKERDVVIKLNSIAPFFVAIDYLDNFEDICELLLINKKCYKSLKMKIYKKLLLREEINLGLRNKIWDGKISIYVTFIFIYTFEN